MKTENHLTGLRPDTPQRRRWLLRCIVAELKNDRGELQEAVDGARRLSVAHGMSFDAFLWEFAEKYYAAGQSEWIFWALVTFVGERFPDDGIVG